VTRAILEPWFDSTVDRALTRSHPCNVLNVDRNSATPVDPVQNWHEHWEIMWLPVDGGPA
jgi:hypothetical protein